MDHVSRGLELRQGGRVLFDSREQGLISHLKTDVDQLVGECGKFIAKAGLVDARLLKGKRSVFQFNRGSKIK